MMAFNEVSLRRRIPWSELSEDQKLKRHQKALVCYRNGFAGQFPGPFEEYGERQVELDRYQRLTDQSQPRVLRQMPPLFDSSERTQLVAMIAANGPMTVREMARARAVDSASTFRTTERLLRSGVVVKRERSGGRKYVSINRAHVAFPELRTLLEVLANHYGTPAVDQARYRHGLPVERDPAPALREDQMFGSVLRSRMLVLLAALEEADVTQLRRLLGANACSVHYTAHALKRSGLLSAESVGNRNVFRMTEDYPGAKEYGDFLAKLLCESPAYGVLRSLLPKITLRWR